MLLDWTAYVELRLGAKSASFRLHLRRLHLFFNSYNLLDEGLSFELLRGTYLSHKAGCVVPRAITAPPSLLRHSTDLRGCFCQALVFKGCILLGSDACDRC